MKFAIVIIALAAIAVAKVRICQAENMARHEMLELQLEYQITLQRQAWDQQDQLDRLLAPSEVQRRASRVVMTPKETGDHLARTPRDGTSR